MAGSPPTRHPVGHPRPQAGEPPLSPLPYGDRQQGEEPIPWSPACLPALPLARRDGLTPPGARGPPSSHLSPTVLSTRPNTQQGLNQPCSSAEDEADPRNICTLVQPGPYMGERGTPVGQKSGPRDERSCG